ncbi:MAG: MerR family transcriptional regulator [Bacteroidetes bacterium]|nr:MAG: MerR family transcriptional regulator [Bacteroidota bacterium]
MKYTIKDLERISGIKAHTLRIWEKRYNVLTPERTETNIRTYDDDDLRKLLNISTLIKGGWKISNVGKLSNEEIGFEVERLFNAVNPATVDCTPYINALVVAMLDLNEKEFERVFANATTRFGLKETMMRVINPFLQQVGLMWSVWKVHPGHEHFASNIIRRKLFGAIDQLMPLPPKEDRFLLFLPEGEHHEIGLLFANYWLRSEGFQTVYLGQNVPFQALVEVVEKINPHKLFTFFIANTDPKAVENYLAQLAQTFPDQTIHVAGSETLLDGLNIPDKVFLLPAPETLEKVIQQ